MKPGKLTRRFILYPLLFVSGCHTLLTGSPVPTWHLEKLNSPISVKSIEPGGLVLGDGRTQKLPLVKRLPADDRLLLAAVKNGVEITNDGSVFGLLWMNRICGNDPCAWDRRRVNLALLAAILSRNNLDESQIPAGVIADIQQLDDHFASDFRPHRYDEGRINYFDLARMHRIEEGLGFARKRIEESEPLEKAEVAEKQERLRWTFPLSDLSD